MKISDLLHDDNVYHNLKVADKNEVIKKLVETMKSSVDAAVVDETLNAVLDRESIMSTGVGKGLAIPHGRVKSLNSNHVAFAILDNEIDYGSIDGKPVKMVFLLVGPQEQSSLHIKMLSRISRLMNNDNFRDRLIIAKNNEELIGIFREEELQYL